MSTIPCSFCGALDHVLAQCAEFLDAARCYERGELAEWERTRLRTLVEAAYPVSSEFLVEPRTPRPLTSGRVWPPIENGTVIGWRYWRVISGWPYMLLASPIHGEIGWTPRVRKSATCELHDHSAPSFDCTCGIYATKDMDSETLAEEAIFKPAIAYGRVSLWGRIVEHKHGYRAQFAYPLDLVLAGDDTALVDRLTTAYGIDVQLADQTLSTLSTPSIFLTPP